MAKKTRKAAAKSASYGTECCDSVEKRKLEAGLLLIIGFVWYLQTFGFFTFGGQYFKMIGEIMIIVIGMLKMFEKPCC